jgi:hypothetical protein
VRRGARSLRGALGAYLAASVIALALLALVLWLGWPRGAGGGGGVELAAESAWAEAALDDGHRQFSVGRGQRVAVPPGHYRLLLRSPDGRTESRELDVGPGDTLVR